MAKLVQLVKAKQAVKIQQRQDTSAAEAPASAVAVIKPTPSTFDLFLEYLSRLQTTVIECMRNVSVATPPAPILPAAESVDLAEPAPEDVAAALDEAMRKSTPTAEKRQLVVPDVSMSDWLDSLNLPDNVKDDPVFSGLQDLGLDWENLYDSLQPDESEETAQDAISPELEMEAFEGPSASNFTGPFTSDKPEIEALGSGSRPFPPYSNSSSSSDISNTTTSDPDVNPLQAAADEAESALTASDSTSIPPSSFASAIAADLRQNSPPSPSPESEAAQLLPYFMGPGPVVPPGVTIDWPGPNKWPSEHPNEQETGNPGNLENMPMLVNDLGPDSEQQVKDFFASLGKEGGGDGNWLGGGGGDDGKDGVGL